MTSIGRPDPAQITAAAVPIRRRELRTPKGKKQLNAPVESLMWNYYREVPAIGNYVTVLSNTATNVAYYPGRIDPELSEPEQEENGPAVDLFEEVGGETAVSSWVSQLVKHLSVAGQAWFVPTNGDQELADNEAPMVATAPEGEPRTKWDVFSTHDLKVMIAKEKKIPFSFDVEIDEDDKRLWRIWQPDPERKQDPDSPVRRTDDECEILVLIKRRRRADLLARLHAGLLFLPATLKNQKDDKGHSWADVLEEGLLASEAPGSIEQLVPLIAFVEPEEAAAATLLKLVVDDGAWLEMLNVATLEQLAIGLDAPPELTTGKASLNHWTAWLISDETYSQHLDPLILRILESLNLWWQSMLVSVKGMAPDEAVMHVLWRNPATAVARPDAFAEALELHDRLVISDDALLATADRDQSDKPDDAEVEARSARAAAAVAPVAEDEEVDAGDDGQGPPEQVAAAGVPDLDLLAAGLTRVDQEALIRLEAEAARQLRERRENLLATIAGAAAAAGYEVGDPDTLPRRLGTERINALVPGALDEAEIFDSDPFDQALLRGQSETARLTAQVGVDRNREADAEDRGQATTMIVAALAGALAASLFRSPAFGSGERGLPGAEWVPTSGLRQAMDVAGGGPATRTGLTASQGIGNGARTVADLDGHGVGTEAFVWVYGVVPRVNFVPHLNLDGSSFDSWDSPILEQRSETWVTGGYWYPGDHRGCRCTYTRVLSYSSEKTRSDVPGEAAPFGDPGANRPLALSGQFTAARDRMVTLAKATGPNRARFEAAIDNAGVRLAQLPDNVQAKVIATMDRFQTIVVKTQNARVQRLEMGRVDLPNVVVPGDSTFPRLTMQTKEFNSGWLADDAADFYRWASPDEMGGTFLHEMFHAVDHFEVLDKGFNPHMSPSSRNTLWENMKMQTEMRRLAKINPEFAYASTSTAEGMAEIFRMNAQGFHLQGYPPVSPEQWRKAFPKLAEAAEMLMAGM